MSSQSEFSDDSNSSREATLRGQADFIPRQQESSYEKVMNYLQKQELYLTQIDSDTSANDIDETSRILDNTCQLMHYYEPKPFWIHSENSNIIKSQRLDQKIRCFHCKKTFKSKGTWFFRHLRLRHYPKMSAEYFEFNFCDNFVDYYVKGLETLKKMY
jgi:hypothetical protein